MGLRLLGEHGRVLLGRDRHGILVRGLGRSRPQRYEASAGWTERGRKTYHRLVHHVVIHPHIFRQAKRSAEPTAHRGALEAEVLRL